MDLKRITSALLGLPLVLVVLIFANKYIVDIVLSLVAILSLYEYFNAVEKDNSRPIGWVGFLSALSIATIHIIPDNYLGIAGMAVIPSIMLLLFVQSIITEMKINFKDIAYTFLGIIYIVFPLICLSLINGLDNGKILIWFVIIAAWGTDIFAYFIGKNFGKHKFTKISPKKTVEGCIGGIIGAVTVAIAYAYFMSTYVVNEYYSLITVAVIISILSVIGQIGDLAASIIKRYVNIKDYSELIPGHGGMLDRIDSLLFISPFAYILLLFI